MRNCIDESTLQAWFDGELAADDAASVNSHLNTCTHCANAARELEAENSIVSHALAVELGESVPTERLRQRIDAAIAQLQVVKSPAAHQSSWNMLLAFFGSFRPVAYASLAIFVLLVITGAFLYLRPDKSSPSSLPQIARATPEVTPGPIPKPSSEQVIVEHDAAPRAPRKSIPKSIRAENQTVVFAREEREYRKTIAKLNQDMQSKPMGPSLQVEYEHNLAVIDNAIAATRDTARKNPKDPQAAQFMLTAYQSKVDFMNLFADARSLEK